MWQTEKVQSVQVTLGQINIEAAAREAGVPPSTLRYDLAKVRQALPDVLANRTPVPKLRNRPAETTAAVAPTEERAVCPECGGKVTNNGTYWVLNWLLMLTMGWLGVQRVRIQRRRCKACGHEIMSPERARQTEPRRACWRQVNRLVGLSRFKLGLSVRKKYKSWSGLCMPGKCR